MIFALALALAAQTGNVLPERNRGTTLYRSCVDMASLMDAPPLIADDDAVDQNPCVNYVSGFTYARELTGQYCAPVSTTLGTVIKLYVQFMGSHQNYLDQPKGAGLMAALQDAYPCPVRRK